MRIEKLSFCNINSLAGKFEIDFTHPELAGPGIFAITGPTGAGKTSILDAIAFALYGKSPRQRGVSKGSNELMSHGTTHCFAEVQFEQGGQHYVARAEQKRARRGANNPFSEARYELRRLAADGKEELLTNSKREFDRLVPQYTGLSFNNFSRCMMLAQGEFAAFLRANESERAEVLSTITGTDIYMRIGEVVHARVAAVDSKLSELKSLPQWDDELREQKVRMKDAADAELKDTAAQLTHTQECLKWLAERDKRAAALSAAKQQLVAATEQWQDFGHQSAADLKWAESALVVQSVATATEQLHGQLQTMQAGRQQAEQQAAQAQQERMQLEEMLKHQHADFQQRLTTLDAALKEVREQMRPQEERLNVTREQALKLAAALEHDDGELKKMAHQLAAIAENINTRQAKLAALQAELDALGQDSVTPEQLTLLQARLGDWQRQRGASEPLPPAEEISAQLTAASEQLPALKTELERRRSIAELRRRQLDIEGQLAALYLDFREGRLPCCPCCGATSPGERHVLPDAEVQAAEQAAVAAATALQQLETHIIKLENCNRLAQFRTAFCAALADCGLPPVQDCAAAAQLVQHLTARYRSATDLRQRTEKLGAELAELKSQFEQQKIRVGEQTRILAQAQEQAKNAADEVQALSTSFTERWGNNTASRLETEFSREQNNIHEQMERERDKLRSLKTKETGATATLQALQQNLASLSEQYEKSKADFTEKWTEQGFADEAAYRAAAEQLLPRLNELRREHHRLKDQLTGATVLLEREQKSCAEHLAANPLVEGEGEESLRERESALTSIRNQQQELLTTLLGEIIADDNARLANEAVKAQRESLLAERAQHDLLKRVLGDKKEGFKQYAQQITFDMLLHRANAELRHLSERYELRRNPLRDNGLGLMVIDSALGNGEGRDCSNLSGGESFIVSLALALGLSRMAGSTRIDSLFLDEGFGTLDRDTLSHVLRSLQKLRADGKMVGIISHVESLSDRIPARIQVSPVRGGRSTLSGPGTTGEVRS